MRHVHSSVEIARPAGDVWPLLAEFRHWPDWGPSVRAVEADAPAVAPGVRGRVQTPVGPWLPFEITAVEPGRSWHWKVAGVPATGHEVEPLDPGHTRVTFSVPVLLAPYVLVLRIGLARLERLAETGSV